MLPSRVACAVTLFSAVLGTVLPGTYHQRRDAPPDGFKAVSSASNEEILVFRIALAQKDFAGLEKALYEASTPGSDTFGSYLSREETNRYIAPSQDTVEAVTTWLTSNGLSISDYSQGGDWITVEATVAQANKLLQADYVAYTHEGLNEPVLRTLSYSLPDEVKDHVVVIHPTVSFPSLSEPPSPYLHRITSTSNSTNIRRSAPISARALPESCVPLSTGNTSDTIENWSKPFGLRCSLDVHGIPVVAPASPRRGSSLWLSGFNNQFANKNSSRNFLKTWRPDLADRQLFDLVTITGGINNQLPAGAGFMINQEMWRLVSTAANVPITFMSVGTDASGDPLVWYLDQVEYLLTLDSPPKVLVHDGTMAERKADPLLARRLCLAYGLLAARGVSIVMPVLLGGVEASFPSGATCDFDVTFPASCPYVTSVGGSQVQDGYESPPPSFISNSGGFSNLFPRPLYQLAAVQKFLNKLAPSVYQGRYNQFGRATPDVVLHQWLTPSPSTGFSLGTPAYAAALFGGAIALLNEELIAARKPTLGFLNPLLYWHPDAFNDLAVGTNPGCNTQGFNSTSGWDPVTGLGSFNYQKLRAAAGL
ncbi:Pro-kumamolisin, activation domain-containing protein [Pterulicium gracile]|uniref:Pro-kumamolisin, activation domain-containing protein n=1 Tax=Pterulicium gracile TaxID=1884261 RepID=A0A5C3QDA5_9AGAR|nr:Pro-kumamolisin, activation domain-containing protein [Pterula gracilis]